MSARRNRIVRLAKPVVFKTPDITPEKRAEIMRDLEDLRSHSKAIALPAGHEIEFFQPTPLRERGRLAHRVRKYLKMATEKDRRRVFRGIWRRDTWARRLFGRALSGRFNAGPSAWSDYVNSNPLEDIESARRLIETGQW